LLFNIAKGSINIDKFTGNNDIGSIETTPQNNFNFEMLKKIERLSGYGKNRNGDILIKDPIWKLLTKDDYNKFVGKEILCRLISYENQDIGLKKNKMLETDSYDDYFILIPSLTIEDVIAEEVPTKTIIVKNRNVDVSRNLMLDALIIENHSSNIDSSDLTGNNILFKNVDSFLQSKTKQPPEEDQDLKNIQISSVFNKSKKLKNV